MNETPPTNEEPDHTDASEELIAADDLIEEISIDGMCGVY